MFTTLQNAISERLLVTIDYFPGVRVIEPHALGIGSDGQPLLRAFQRSGVSLSGDVPNWKLFRVDRIRAANTNGEQFATPRAGYRRGDRAMTRGIIVQL